MKNYVLISLLVLFAFSFISCVNDEITEDQDIQLFEESIDLIARAPCTIDGPDCGNPGSQVVFTYDSAVHNQNITWSVEGGNISLSSGQGTDTATFQLASNFNGGTVNVTAGICDLSKQILRCSTPISCGSIGRVYELNAFGSDNVVFYVVPSLNSGWSITNSTFVVTRDSGIISTHSGSLNSNGLPQIIIPVPCSPHSGRVDKVEVTVNASSGSNTCTKTVETDFLSVCGTGGFN
ncbi:hypothetical protein LV716_05400 [Flagellimonas sp. HMM57]|uniref:hypothetical protein n=1 Tax=unclassified Flagellimonas TaxID=2644544 RepID=UPI0013D7E375|nr:MULTISPECIES: hypothetical protein [unclassified Flagellimonas]UII77208.1 hypothetical protein LV716_05400 [Flagellimonas sp. HMM57]